MFILFNAINSIAQNVGINDDNSAPDQSAMLDIKSSDKGLLIPRVQLDDMNTTDPVTNPANGLLIYANSTSSEDEGFYYWNGSKWVKLITTTGTGDIPNLQDVLNEGNSANSMRITDLSEPMNLQDAATKYYVDNNDDVNDTDYDSTNETIQTFSFDTTSNIITVNDGSGDKTVDLSILDDDTDADSDPANEIQTISKVGSTVTLSNSGGSFTDEVNDADADNTNEIQVLSISNDTLYLENGGYAKLPGLVLPYSNTLNTSDINFNIRNDGSGDVMHLYSEYGSVIKADNYGGNDVLIINANGAGRGMTIDTETGGGLDIDVHGGTSEALNVSHYGTGFAAWFNGDVRIQGNLEKTSGSFVIDHPLDPENKILAHSFVESPEMLNIYKGRSHLVNGEIIIKLPDYYDALNHPSNREINLTPINGWSPLYMKGKIENNQFTVKTTPEGNPDQEFSWIVYAVRNDAYAKDHPIVVEEEKGVNNNFEKGKLLYGGTDKSD